MPYEASKPHIPATEYPERWRRVQAMMAARDLDALVAYADDRASFGPAHARWLANFPVHFEPACILVPREGDPVMLVGPESDQYALLAGRIPDVRVLARADPSRRGLPVRQDPEPGRGDVRHRRLDDRGPAGRPGRPRPDRRRPDGRLRRTPSPAADGSTWRTTCATCAPGSRQPSSTSSATRTGSPSSASRPAWTRSLPASPSGRSPPRSRPRCAGPAPRGPASTRSWRPGRTPGPSWPAPRSAASSATTWSC